MWTKDRQKGKQTEWKYAWIFFNGSVKTENPIKKSGINLKILNKIFCFI